MGEIGPLFKKQPVNLRKSGKVLLIAAFTTLVVVALFRVFYLQDETGVPMLSPGENARLQKRLKEIDDSEQYALVAEIDGWYPCLHSGRTIYHLKAGEVWKYGVTSKGKLGRYSAEFLFGNNVFYFVQFKGTFSECLKQEQIKLFNYPYLPESLSRPPEQRLPRPPFNRIMR